MATFPAPTRRWKTILSTQGPLVEELEEGEAPEGSAEQEETTATEETGVAEAGPIEHPPKANSRETLRA
jgi:hypothetical protein